MKNLNNITNFIKYEKFYEILPNLKQLNNGTFSLYILTDNNKITYIVNIGTLNTYNFYVPLEINKLSEFIIFNKNITFSQNKNYNKLDLLHLNEIYIYKLSILLTKYSNNIKNTNRLLSKKEENLFLYSLKELNNIDFNEVLNIF